MAEGGRDGIRDVGPPRRASSCHEPGDHPLDLFLFGPPVSCHGLLDCRWAVLKNPQARNPEYRENHAARVGKLERRSRADTVERRLDRCFRRCMLLDDGRHPCVQAREPIG